MGAVALFTAATTTLLQASRSECWLEPPKATSRTKGMLLHCGILLSNSIILLSICIGNTLPLLLVIVD